VAAQVQSYNVRVSELHLDDQCHNLLLFSCRFAAMLGMKIFSIVTFICLFAGINAISTTDLPFGSCSPGKENCSQCYLTLKKSLLSKDDNIRNLSLAFYPPRAAVPEFVTVLYKFEDLSDEEDQHWFWTHDSSYLFFPLKTFQYLSLFFGKLEKQVSQKVTLTLDAECNMTKTETMNLLTQRVSLS
jgi:hypothetical protein